MYDLVVENSIGKIKKSIYWKTEKEQICQNYENMAI